MQNKKYQSAGFASLGCAACFVVGFIMIFWIEPGVNLDPSLRLNFILNNGVFFQIWYFIIFVVFGACLLILIKGLSQWIGTQETISHNLSVLTGFIWSAYALCCGLVAILSIQYLLHLPSSQQSSNWYVIYAIQIGLGDGAEWVGGIWLVVLSFRLFRYKKGAVSFRVVSLLIGVTGCLAIFPNYAFAGAIFGMSQIIWFIWLSFLLFAESTRHSTTKY